MKSNKELGSALIYVFIGIALFGILMFVFSRGGNQSSSSLTDQQAKTKAIEIMGRSDSIERAVNKLISKGCSINDLNFYSSHVTQVGTANPSAPPDGSCDVYSPNGGKLTWEGCPDLTFCSTPSLYVPQIPNSISITSLGDKTEDLVYHVLVRKEVCIAINSMLGLPTTNLGGAAGDGSPYIGTFSTNRIWPSLAVGDFNSYIGKTSGCLRRLDYNTTYGGEFYMYYKVLIVL